MRSCGRRGDLLGLSPAPGAAPAGPSARFKANFHAAHVCAVARLDRAGGRAAGRPRGLAGVSSRTLVAPRLSTTRCRAEDSCWLVAAQPSPGCFSELDGGKRSGAVFLTVDYFSCIKQNSKTNGFPPWTFSKWILNVLLWSAFCHPLYRSQMTRVFWITFPNIHIPPVLWISPDRAGGAVTLSEKSGFTILRTLSSPRLLL